MDLEDKEKILAEMEICQGLNPMFVRRLAEAARLQSWPRGEFLFQADSRDTEMFLLVKGRVQIEIDVPGLEENTVLSLVRPGDAFGEFSFIDGSPRSAAARAIDNVDVLVLTRNDMERIMNQNPELGYALILNIARILCRKIRDSNMRLRSAMI